MVKYITLRYDTFLTMKNERDAEKESSTPSTTTTSTTTRDGKQ